MVNWLHGFVNDDITLPYPQRCVEGSTTYIWRWKGQEQAIEVIVGVNKTDKKLSSPHNPTTRSRRERWNFHRFGAKEVDLNNIFEWTWHELCQVFHFLSRFIGVTFNNGRRLFPLFLCFALWALLLIFDFVPLFMCYFIHKTMQNRLG